MTAAFVLYLFFNITYLCCSIKVLIAICCENAEEILLGWCCLQCWQRRQKAAHQTNTCLQGIDAGHDCQHLLLMVWDFTEWTVKTIRKSCISSAEGKKATQPQEEEGSISSHHIILTLKISKVTFIVSVEPHVF